METLYCTLDGSDDSKVFAKAGSIIKRGGLVAFPTETVYGLGADALRSDACAKIYEAKGRPSDNPLIVHIAEFEALKSITTEIPKAAYRLAESFWPGPLTMILKKSEKVPYSTTGGLDTVAVRMPSHETALRLIKESGGYIAAPSANTSGRPSPTKAEHVRDDMDGRIDMIIDAGAVGIGVESTIIDLTEETPVLLRPGYINIKMLEEVCGQVKVDPAIGGTLADGTKPKAPGMKYKHYAPKGELYIVKGDSEAVARHINALVKTNDADGIKTGVIATEENLKFYDEGVIKCIGSRADEETIAKNLFSLLREFDDIGVQVIYSEELDTPRLGMAVMNRLLKAAAHRIIEV